jgi:hypothetical protein
MPHWHNPYRSFESRCLVCLVDSKKCPETYASYQSDHIHEHCIKRFLLKVSETLDSDDVDLTTSPRDTSDEEDEVLEDELALRRQVLWSYGTIAQGEQDIVLNEIKADEAKEVEDIFGDTPKREIKKKALEDDEISYQINRIEQE